MTPEQLDIARALAGHSKFEWRAGMKPCAAELAPFVWKLDRVEDGGWSPQHCDDIALPQGWPDTKREAWPDLTDDATGGVLLGMVGKGHNAEHYKGVTGASVWIVRECGHEWVTRNGPHGFPPNHCGATLAEACARALLAQWAREVTP